jgi:hypothetical protein
MKPLYFMVWKPLLLGFCFLLLLLWARKRKLFDAKDRQRLHHDGAVLRHELGHAIAWFCVGGKVERITFTRLKWASGTSTQYPLMGRTELSYANGTAEESAENAELVAERILAGESAARKWAGMSRNSICTGGLKISRNCDLDAILMAHGNSPEDFISVLGLAVKWGKSEWSSWIRSRLKAVRALVDANWGVIQHLASKHERSLPTKLGDIYEIDGERLMGELRTLSVLKEREAQGGGTNDP